MARWQPNARDRLAQAALGLYVERGFDHTTVAQIAERAGLTERTFFRHFADKREVLFDGQDALRALIVDTVTAAPADASAMQAVAGALDAVAAMFAGRHDHAVRRQAVIAAHDGLRERELIKLAGLVVAIAESLRRRGTPEPSATLAAEAGIAVFRVAFERWVDPAEPDDLGRLMRDSLEQLTTVTAAR